MSYERKKRIRNIVNLLNQKAELSVKEIAEMLHVSGMTVRRDLNELEKQRTIRRTHGGAALLDPAASARMAVGEAITNIAAADIDGIEQIRLSCNWMAAAGHPGEDAGLHDAVRAVGMELCPALGIAVPVGKDSMSLRAVWEEDGEERSVTAPLSLIVTANRGCTI